MDKEYFEKLKMMTFSGYDANYHSEVEGEKNKLRMVGLTREQVENVCNTVYPGETLLERLREEYEYRSSGGNEMRRKNDRI